MYKKWRQGLAVVLTLCLLLTGTPVLALQGEPEYSFDSATVSALQREAEQALQLPDIVTAAEAEQNGYVARLASQESNLNTLVFQNRDGSCTMRLYAHPVKYVTEGGETRDISLAMRQENTGDIVSADHGVETVFSPLMQNGIRLSYEDISLRMLPLLGDEGLSSGPSESVGAGATVRPMVRAELSPEGRTVRYTLDAVTSLEYELTYAGFKEDIVVRQYTGQTEYRFLLQTGGLQLEQRRESLVLTDDGGTVRATLGDILIFTADERNNTRGELQFEPVRDGELYLLTVCLDADYLRDERTVYPIRIDPTLEVSYYTAGANAIEDVTLNSETDSDGSSTALFLGRRSYGAARVLMKFPGIDYGVLSSAVTIQSAYVEFRDLMCEAEELPVSCHRFIGNNWTESTAEWSNVNVNKYDTTPLSSHVISYANGLRQPEGHWYRFPVRDAVVTWQLNAARRNQGLLFKTTDAIENGSSYLYKTIGSFNRSSNRPSIVITYGPRYSVTVQQTSASVLVGGTVQLSATATPSGSEIVWVSNDRRIATVDALTGVVTGVAPGTAEIRAAVYDNTGLSIYSSPCTVTVRDPDPFHPYNIEYMRIKKYDRTAFGGDSDITTVVTKSYLSSNQYFEAYAPGRQNIAFTVNNSLIETLNAQESSFQEYPNMYLPNFYYHLAKLGVDEMVDNNIIDYGSAEYYGIWASESNRLLLGANKATSQIRLVLATVTAVYSIYNFVSSIKTMSMTINTTQTYYNADYRSAAYLADDLLDDMTNNPNSNAVMLGTSTGDVSYNQVADSRGMSYFYSQNYDNYVEQYGSDAMLATNRLFISKAKDAGKTFWFSHDPIKQLSNVQYESSTYTYELRYLEEIYEIIISNSNIKQSGDYWYLVVQ